MEPMADLASFTDAIKYFTRSEIKNWREVLKVGENYNVDLAEKRKLSWIWPTEESLQDIKCTLKKLKINKIISIGCGCGLLEWIFRECAGITVFGLEIDRTWWESKYAIKSLIRVNYIDDLKPSCLPETFLQRCCNANDWNFAIMFCYFNNRSAFLNYLQMYKGEWIIIIGPSDTMDIHTDPCVLDPEFPKDTNGNWTLCEQKRIDSYGNLLAIYNKIQNK